MTERLDLARLEAYADGELDAEAMSETAELLMQEPEALARVRALHKEAALLRAAYQEAAEAPVPPTLLAAIDSGFARRRRGGSVQRYALAAAIGFALVAGLAGYLLGEFRARGELAAVAAREAEDQRILSDTIERALERAASGEAVAWRNPDSGSYGEVVPVRTYRSKSNHWCREYLASKVTGDIEEKTRAIACRAGNGDWVKAEQLYYDS
jgi:surface antigen